MKFAKFFIVLLFLNITIQLSEPPTVSINYLPKKQWKLSKHDLADIKLDIEREMKNKILQVQMDWENRERNEQAMYYNQFAPVTPPAYFPPSNYPQPNPGPIPRKNPTNFPRFEEDRTGETAEQTSENVNESATRIQKDINYSSDYKESQNYIDSFSIKKKFEKTVDKIQKLKQEIDDLKSSDNKIKLKLNSGSNNKTFTVPKYNNQPSVENTINNIINKYSRHKINSELDLFNNMFKNYNQTNSNHVNINEVNQNIEETVNNVSDEKTLSEGFEEQTKTKVEESEKKYEKVYNKINNLK